jgi:hypothetical protein
MFNNVFMGFIIMGLGYGAGAGIRQISIPKNASQITLVKPSQEVITPLVVKRNIASEHP